MSRQESPASGVRGAGPVCTPRSGDGFAGPPWVSLVDVAGGGTGDGKVITSPLLALGPHFTSAVTSTPEPSLAPCWGA